MIHTFQIWMKSHLPKMYWLLYDRGLWNLSFLKNVLSPDTINDIFRILQYIHILRNFCLSKSWTELYCLLRYLVNLGNEFFLKSEIRLRPSFFKKSIKKGRCNSCSCHYCMAINLLPHLHQYNNAHWTLHYTLREVTLHD